MDRSLALLGIGLVFGGGIGFLIATANGVTLDGHAHTGHNDHASQSTGHAHDAPLSLPDDGTAPQLEISVVKDLMSGWNLHVSTQSFRFAPENASTPDIAGEGHAHVYVDGVKIARLYGPWMHLSALPQGNPTIKVVLNSNDHRPLSVDGTPVDVTLSIQVD
jgi:hypothetical protein